VRDALVDWRGGARSRRPMDRQKFSCFKPRPALGLYTNMLADLATILMLLFASSTLLRRKFGAPAALGTPYVREGKGG